MHSFLSSLARRQPQLEFTLKAPHQPRPSFPHQYDRVHDAYGPGSYIAWILTTSSLLLQLCCSRENSTRLLRNADKDAFVVLAYPAFAAGHLISQIVRYPGDRSDMWTTEQEDVVQYAAAIWASTRICILAISITTMIIARVAFMHRSYGRLAVASILNVLMFTACVLAGIQGDWKQHLLIGISAIVLLPICISASVAYFFLAARYMVIALANLRALMVLVVRLDFQQFGWNMLKIIASSVAVLFGFWCFLIGNLGYFLCMPVSQHSAFEPFQILALLGGLANFGFTLRALKKDYGRHWWTTVFKDDDESSMLIVVPSTQNSGIPKGW